MACELDKGLDSTTGCPPESPGLDEQYLWLVNRADITFTKNATKTKLYDSFAMGTGKVAYRWKIHHKGFNYSDEMTENDNTGAQSWAPDVNGRILGLDEDISEAIEALQGTDLVAIVKAKSDRVLVFGSLAGLKLKGNTSGSEADNYGESFTIGGEEEPGKYYVLNDTDLTTTLAALVAAETP